MRSPVNVIAVVAWVALLLELDRVTNDGNAEAIVAIGACVALGAIVGRPWAIVIPPAAGLPAALYYLVAPADHCASCEPDGSTAAGLVLLAIFAGAGLIAAAVGYGLRRAVSRLATPAGSGSR